MTHMETQQMIMPFINEQLKDDELEEFLLHMKTCEECMEELEVYYTLITSMKQLDNDEDLSADYHQDLVNLLETREEEIEYKRNKYKLKRLMFVFIVGVIALSSTFTFGEFIVQDIIHKVPISDFMPEQVELISDKDLPESIERQFPDIYMYLRENDKEGATRMSEYYGDIIWEDMIIQTEFGEAVQIPEWIVLNY